MLQNLQGLGPDQLRQLDSNALSQMSAQALPSNPAPPAAAAAAAPNGVAQAPLPAAGLKTTGLDTAAMKQPPPTAGGTPGVVTVNSHGSTISYMSS